MNMEYSKLFFLILLQVMTTWAKRPKSKRRQRITRKKRFFGGATMARPRRLLTVLAAASRASAFDVPFFGFNWKELVVGGAGVDPKDGVLGRVQVKSDPLAVCNDGSPAVYYLKEGDPTLWLVYLEGGGWCYDEQTCTKRAQVSPKMTSSNGGCCDDGEQTSTHPSINLSCPPRYQIIPSSYMYEAF